MRQAAGGTIMQAKRRSGSNRVECTTGPRTPGDITSAEICGIRIHGLPEGQDHIADVPAV